MKTRFIIAIALAITVVAVVGYVFLPHARPDASAYLQRAYANAQKADYTGKVITAVFYCGRKFETESLIHRDRAIERIEYTSKPVQGVVVISTNDSTRTYRPDLKQVLVSHTSKSLSSSQNLDLLLKNYSVYSAGSDHVDGISVGIIDLIPKHKGNPSKRLWLDRETGVTLKSEDYSSSGELRSRMEFESISYTKNATNDIAIEPPGAYLHWVAREKDNENSPAKIEKSVGIRIVYPKHLPPGYILDSVGVYSCECACGHKAIHLRYTNGLNSLSIYQTPLNTSCGSNKCSIHCPPSGKCEVRDTHQALVATMSLGGRSIIVVSDLPKEEIEEVAKSIR